MQIKNKVHNLKKGGKTLKEYFKKIQHCVDSLASINKPISTYDHILYILVGLGSEFQSMIFVISTRTNSPSIQEVTSLLLAQEAQNDSKPTIESTIPTVNTATQA